VILRLKLYSLLFFFFLFYSLSYAKFNVLPEDGIPYLFENRGQIYAIGDIHGDFDSLLKILLNQNIITETGHWNARSSQLVFVGDLIQSGPDSRLIIEFLMNLEKEAILQGGEIHTLLGNHEIFFTKGDFLKLSADEKILFDNAPRTTRRRNHVHSAISGDTEIAKWLRTRNSVIQIGEYIFMHGSIGRWALDSTFGEVNATVRAWISHFQKPSTPQPPVNTYWVVDHKEKNGPSFRRGFKDLYDGQKPTDGIRKSRLNEILSHLNARYFIVGHNPTHDEKISLSHSYYGKKVISIDTNISRHKKGTGSPSLLEIKNGRFIPHHYEYPTHGPHKIKEERLTRLLNNASRRQKACIYRLLGL